MSKLWLMVDVNNLAHRAYHAMGHLDYNGQPTGVAYGVLRDVCLLSDRFQPAGFAFAFDYGASYRANRLPTYKSSRKKKYDDESAEEKKARAAMHHQIRCLRDEWLPKIGFRNLCFADGYEADDVLASLVKHSLKEKDEAILVSSDQDLYQLLAANISIWNPHQNKIITQKKFTAEYRILPKLWNRVKAMAGCATDDVPGIQGVGEKTAIKYLLDELPTTTKAFAGIVKGVRTIARNLELVTLPLEGTPRFTLVDDNVSTAGWRSVAKDLGARLPL